MLNDWELTWESESDEQRILKRGVRIEGLEVFSVMDASAFLLPLVPAVSAVTYVSGEKDG